MHHITISITNTELDDPITTSVSATEHSPNIFSVGETAFTAVLATLRAMGYHPDNIRELQETTDLKDL